MRMPFLLPHAVDASATSRPDAEAFRFDAQALRYDQLAARSDALARTLVEHGVQRGDRVGIYMAKSLYSPVALYGIMKAGAAYVPIDPAAPAARLAWLVRDCGIRHLVSEDAKRSMLAALAREGALPACLLGVSPGDDLPSSCLTWDTIFAGDSAVALPRMNEDGLAYIIYTSGSTGTPKGIMHTHRSGLAYAKLSAMTYAVAPDDRLANHSPLHFDMSTFDYFTGPLCGATTVIVPEEHTRVPASLSKLIEDERVTIWYSVSSALAQLLARGVLEKRNLARLRWVLFGGDLLSPRNLRALIGYMPNARFSNVYGPAEVNQCTFYHVPAGGAVSDEPIPIGEVWDNTEGLIVDEHDRLVAPGSVGELLIRSPTMMRGYWNRPDLSARAYYYRDGSEHERDRFYRTGDLVRERDDGQLEFLGRKDRQIKSRGYRVELEEVELALSAHDAVDEAAAVPIADDAMGYRIEAAVTLRPGAQLETGDLRQHLRERLAWYAVPGRIEVIDEFPRTPTGKIDRGVLRERLVAEAAPSSVSASL